MVVCVRVSTYRMVAEKGVWYGTVNYVLDSTSVVGVLCCPARVILRPLKAENVLGSLLWWCFGFWVGGWREWRQYIVVYIVILMIIITINYICDVCDM